MQKGLQMQATSQRSAALPMAYFLGFVEGGTYVRPKPVDVPTTENLRNLRG
ncbi:hypothetical protein HDF16_004766 [Granulicella aggregans]|uniref:Uncharacterized protein n=1 Tax=Granulicella aggregans TaxID=474949 RepID=A0A7W7ZHJ8_9BACT|nr:hypothetical protein [Granulicella aggregans]